MPKIKVRSRMLKLDRGIIVSVTRGVCHVVGVAAKKTAILLAAQILSIVLMLCSVVLRINSSESEIYSHVK